MVPVKVPDVRAKNITRTSEFCVIGSILKTSLAVVCCTLLYEVPPSIDCWMSAVPTQVPVICVVQVPPAGTKQVEEAKLAVPSDTDTVQLCAHAPRGARRLKARSEEHTSELQSR